MQRSLRPCVFVGPTGERADCIHCDENFMWPSFTSIQAHVDVKPTTWAKQQQHTQIPPQSWVPSVITSAAVTAAARSSMDPRRPRTQATFSGPVFHTYILWATISQYQIYMVGAWALHHSQYHSHSGAHGCQLETVRATSHAATRCSGYQLARGFI